MKIFEVDDKRKFMPLLLLADEQESMIERYIDKAVMYVLDDGGVKGEIAVIGKGEILEIKNLAVAPAFQGQGYGKKLIEFIRGKYRGVYKTLFVGTGDSPLTVPFYEKCGFVKSHTVKNFFTDNYDRPIIECGIVLSDMIYLKIDL